MTKRLILAITTLVLTLPAFPAQADTNPLCIPSHKMLDKAHEGDRRGHVYRDLWDWPYTFGQQKTRIDGWFYQLRHNCVSVKGSSQDDEVQVTWVKHHKDGAWRLDSIDPWIG